MSRINLDRLSLLTYFSAAAVVAAATAMVATPTLAAQDVDLRAKASPELMAFTRRFFLKEWVDRDIFVYHGKWDSVHDKELPLSVDKDIEKGEADLNDDGVKELFFRLPSSCGSAGCIGLILQKQGTNWRIIYDDNGGGFTILDDSDSGYHRLCTGFLMRWNGREYQEVYASPHDEKNDYPVKCDQTSSVLSIKQITVRQDVELKTNAAPELMSFAREYFSKSPGNGFVSDGNLDPQTHEFMDLSADRDVEKGEADLNGDGINEVFFLFKTPAYCGEYGCKVAVLAKEGENQWVILEDYGYHFHILDEADGGYHRICVGSMWKWNGREYERVFATKEDQENFRPMKCD